MHTTIVRDDQGGEYIVPQSHKSTKAAIDAIARAKIAAYGLQDTPTKYLRKCAEVQAKQSEAGQGVLVALVALAVVAVAVLLVLGPTLAAVAARLAALAEL